MLKKIYFHIDFDAFFASVEEILHPQYQNKPVVVCAMHENSVCCSANYLARSYGIKAGMPVFQIKKIAPKNTIYTVSHLDLYDEVSDEVFNYIRNNINRKITIYSIDECWLEFDKSNIKHNYNYYLNKAKNLQENILNKFKLSVSIGIGKSMFLAKMASDFKKPYGITCILNQEDIETKLWPLDINKMFMVGKNLSKKLNELKIYTIKDLANYKDFNKLKKILTKNYINYLYDAKGIEHETSFNKDLAKSFSIKRTFTSSLANEEEIKEYLNYMIHELTNYLNNNKAKAKRLVCHVENIKHEIYTTKTDLAKAVNEFSDLSLELYNLFEHANLNNNLPIRSLNFILSNISYDELNNQLDLNEYLSLNNKDKANINWQNQVKQIINEAAKKELDLNNANKLNLTKKAFRH